MSVPPTESHTADNRAGSIWDRPTRGSRGPEPTYSRDAIVSAAIELADSQGLSAVSMRAVAAALNTGAGTLYRHLASREDLLELMADRVTGELQPHPTVSAEGWLATMVAVARRHIDLHRRHPWLVDVLPHVSGAGPQALTWFDACLGILEPLECPARAKFEAIAMLNGIVTLFARSEAAQTRATFSPSTLAEHPHLAAALAEPAAPEPSIDLLERTLRSVLTGLLT